MFYHGNIPGFTTIWENIFGTFSRHQIHAIHGRVFFLFSFAGGKNAGKDATFGGGRMNSLWHWSLAS